MEVFYDVTAKVSIEQDLYGVFIVTKHLACQ